MDLALGTEPTKEYYAFELAAAAKKVIEEIMMTKPKENVVISTDTKGDWRVVLAMAQAAYALGATPTVILYEARPYGAMDPPPPVAAAVAKADVWIECAAAYTLYSDSQQAATKGGTRYTCIGVEMDVDSLVTAIGKVDYPLMLKLGDKLVELTQAAKEIRMTGPNGMDVSCKMGESKVKQSGGLGDHPGAEVMLGGQVGWLPAEETINGTIAFDGMVYPPAEVGILRTPVILKVENGRIVGVTGGSEAGMVEAYLAGLNDPNMYRLAHYTYGFNPGVTKLSGRVNQDERLFGCAVFGFGATYGRKAASHFDGVTVRPSVYLDGMVIEREGKYVHPELVELCRKMGVAGY